VDDIVQRINNHLKRVAARHPGVWRRVEDFRAARGKDLPTWPNWCFLPLAGAVAIATRGAPVERLDPADPDVLSAVGEVPLIGALAAWRMTRGIYAFDPDVFESVWDTPVGRIPTEILFRLPEWCIYVPTPGKGFFEKCELYGFFAHLEYDSNTGRPELRLVADSQKGCLPGIVHLAHSDLREAVLAAVREGARVAGPAVAGRDLQALADVFAGLYQPLVSLVLYICTVSGDVRDAASSDRVPRRPEPRKTKAGPRFFAADRPTVWETGYRMGEALRSARASAPSPGLGGTHAGPRPHIRRAHWHSFWTGPESEPSRRKLIVRWLPPIAVALDSPDDLVPTIRRV